MRVVIGFAALLLTLMIGCVTIGVPVYIAHRLETARVEDAKREKEVVDACVSDIRKLVSSPECQRYVAANHELEDRVEVEQHRRELCADPGNPAATPEACRMTTE